MPASPSSSSRSRRSFRFLLLGVAALLIVIAIVLSNRFFAYDVKDDVTIYFDKSDFVGKHYGEPVLYEQVPPTGGYHSGIPQTCGFYDRYIGSEHAVHSMEHGAAWITYDPTLPADQIEELRELSTQPYVLVSPYPGMDQSVVISAWGHQMKLSSVDSAKIDAFMREYKNSEKYTPEFGASCSGGTNETTDVVPQQQPFVQNDMNAPPIGGIRDIDATATAEATAGIPGATPAASPGTSLAGKTMPPP